MSSGTIQTSTNEQKEEKNQTKQNKMAYTIFLSLAMNFVEFTDGTYGDGCAYNCLCLNGADCDTATGACRCSAGWEGPTCSSPCQPGNYGEECGHMCLCENNSTCDHVTGICRFSLYNLNKYFFFHLQFDFEKDDWNLPKSSVATPFLREVSEQKIS